METVEKPQPTLSSAVLVICDDPHLATALAASLASYGIAVRWAATEAEGLQLLPDGNFDLLVCDAPVLDRVGRLTLPIIVLTSNRTIQSFNDSTLPGFSDIIKKPFEFDELVWRIRTALHRKQVLDELTQHN